MAASESEVRKCMNEVEPIRDKGMVQDIGDYLREQSERNYILFLFGIYSGLRISDILKLRARDVRGKGRITLTEKKTGKEQKFLLNKELKTRLAKYVMPMKDYEFLFRSRQGCNSPISRQQAWNILRKAGQRFGLDSIGTHTLRKTFGYHLYQQTHDIVLVQHMLNHSTQEYTLRYIGITRDTMDNAMNNLSYH